MFERFFIFIRQGIKQAILGGIEDAQEEMTRRIDARPESLLIEADPETNGRTKRRTVAR